MVPFGRSQDDATDSDGGTETLSSTAERTDYGCGIPLEEEELQNQLRDGSLVVVVASVSLVLVPVE